MSKAPKSEDAMSMTSRKAKHCGLCETAKLYERPAEHHNFMHKGEDPKLIVCPGEACKLCLKTYQGKSSKKEGWCHKCRKKMQANNLERHEPKCGVASFIMPKK